MIEEDMMEMEISSEQEQDKTQRRVKKEEKNLSRPHHQVGRAAQKETEDFWGPEDYSSADSSGDDAAQSSLPGGPEDEALAGGSAPTLDMVPPSPDAYTIPVKL